MTARCLSATTAFAALLLATADVGAQAPPPAPSGAPSPWISNDPSAYGAPAPPPPPARRELARPRSIEEFKQARRDLREALDEARDADRDAEAARIRDDLDLLEEWYREDTERRSGGAMAGGIVMMGVGGLGIVIGGLTLLVASVGESLGGNNDGAQAAGATGLFVGLGLVGGGIPLMIYGSRRVMVAENALAPVAPAPRAAVRVGPGSLAIEGSF